MRTHRDLLLPELIRQIEEIQTNKKISFNGKKVLEIGQGNDTQIRLELEKFGLIYTATDTLVGNNNMFAKLKGEEYHNNAMEDLSDFKNDTFDLVVSVHSFEHTKNPFKVLEEIRKVLKPGGIVLIVTPYHCKHHVLDSDPDHYFVLTELQFIRLLASTGYNIVNSNVKKDWTEREQDWNVFSIGEK